MLPVEGPQPFVLEARLTLDPEVDPASVGAAVTTRLCGSPVHDGPCRWPHNNSIEPGCPGPNLLRVLFVAESSDGPEVLNRIRTALENGPWGVVSTTERDPSSGEQPLAERLMSGPRTDPTGPRAT